MVKKVGFFLGDYTKKAGTERTCFMVVNELAKDKDYKVFLFVNNKKDDLPGFFLSEKVEVIFLDIVNIKRSYFSFVFGLRSFLKEKKIDFLVCVESLSFLFLLLPCLLLGVKRCKVIVWEHFNATVDLGLKYRNYARKLATYFAYKIIVLTDKDILLWKNKYEIKNKVTAINNASPFKISSHSYDVSSKKIIAVGRLTYQKGFDKLLNIWKKFVEDHKELICDGWHLDIVGTGEDKDLLENIIKDNNILDSVNLVGHCDDMEGLYKQSSFLIMTSRFEGLPMTLLEAQSFGLPIISYDCLTGPSEIIRDNNGILVEYNDLNQFLEGLHTLVVNKDLRIKFSSNAKVNVKRFGMENIINKWKAVFR